MRNFQARQMSAMGAGKKRHITVIEAHQCILSEPRHPVPRLAALQAQTRDQVQASRHTRRKNSAPDHGTSA